MNAEQLQRGRQVSAGEYDYILRIIRDIRNTGYEGPIDVVGSRTKWHRFSRRVYDAECGYLLLEPRENDVWFTVLNELARIHDLSPINLKTVRKFLPQDAPKPVFDFLNPENTWICPDADLDLQVTVRGDLIGQKYTDSADPSGSGLTIDIFEPGEEKYIHLPTVYDY